MALSPENQALVSKLVAVHERATRGDQEAVHFVKSLKTRALSGDEKSRKLYNTLAVIHWRKRKGGDYDKAEAYYLRLKAKEPTAMAKLQTLLTRVRSGDQEALMLFRVLKSIHGKFKSSAFSDGPGAPKIGGYGMPQQHRPGIIIGGIAESLSPHAFQHVFGGQQPPHIGHGGGYPMNHSPYGTYGQALYGNPFAVSGNRMVVGNAPQQLTAESLAGLLSLMIRVRAMPLAAAVSNFAEQFTQQFAQPQQARDFPGGGSSQFTTTPSPTGFTTVPQPSGGSTVPQQQTMQSVLATVQTALAPKGATGAEMEAFKTANADPNHSISSGQLVCNNNPFMQVERKRIAEGDPEALAGFFHGIVTSLGNSAEGPGQNAQRDRMLYPTIEQNAGLNGRRLYGFRVARDMMYKATLARTPIILPQTVKSLGRVKSNLTPAEEAAATAARLANQGICNSAKSAADRNSPAAPGLFAQCAATRDANIAKGDYFVDAMPTNDPRYRVALTNAGEAVIAKNPQLAQVRAQLPVSRQRGFTMAMGVRNGRMDPGFPAFVRPGLIVDPELFAGFEMGMNMQ